MVKILPCLVLPLLRINYYVPKPPPDKNVSLDAKDLVCGHQTLSDFGMDSQLGAFLEKLQNESQEIALQYFPSILVPYLRSISEILDVQGQPAEFGKCQALFLGLMTQYVIRFVGREAAKSQNWSKKTCGCGCEDCKELDVFLASPTETIQRIKVNGDRRKHINRQIPTHSTDCEISIDTERHKLAYTLVITKSHRRYDKAFTNWSKRAKEAREQMSSIATEDKLKGLLGYEYYSIRNLCLVTLSMQSQSADGRLPESRVRAPLETLTAARMLEPMMLLRPIRTSGSRNLILKTPNLA